MKLEWTAYCKALREYESKKKSIKKAIFSSRENKCAKCGTTDNLTLDHIDPLRKSGNNNLDNFQILCMECNRKKGDR